MSTLWTPSGEHPIPRKPSSTQPPQPAPGGQDRSGGGATGGGSAGGRPSEAPGGRQRRAAGVPEGYTEEEVRQAQEEMDAVREQLLRAPVEVVVANHAMGLWELAALHLSQDPPGLPEAKLAIDAMGAMLDGVGSQLGEAEQALADGLSQIRMAFVQIANASRGKPEGAE